MSPDWPVGLIDAWHPIAYRNELKQTPVAVRLMDRRLVLFAAQGGPALLEDRCPHRNVPLSAGRVRDGQVECAYHGWRFDGAGQCRKVAGSAELPAVSARAYPVREHAGLIWTTFGESSTPLPTLFDEIAESSFDTFWWHLPPSTGSIGDAIENLLDPIHSYFLHPGLVRQSAAPEGVAMTFEAGGSRASASYTEPGRALTLLQRLTEGRRARSWGHYRAPAQVQIAFEDDRGVHAAISVVFSPVGAGETRPYACFSTRKGRAPGWLKRALIIAFHRKVLNQDLAMLRLQREQCEHFGGLRYGNGPIDFFGPAIWDGLNGRPIASVERSVTLTS